MWEREKGISQTNKRLIVIINNSMSEKKVNVMEQHAKLVESNPDTFSHNLQMFLVAQTLFENSDEYVGETIIEAYTTMASDQKNYRIN